MEYVGKFYIHLVLQPFDISYGPFVYFQVIGYILRLFGIFFPFWYVVARRIWQPWLTAAEENQE
jgi:hypothetical protein